MSNKEFLEFIQFLVKKKEREDFKNKLKYNYYLNRTHK